MGAEGGVVQRQIFFGWFLLSWVSCFKRSGRGEASRGFHRYVCLQGATGPRVWGPERRLVPERWTKLFHCHFHYYVAVSCADSKFQCRVLTPFKNAAGPLKKCQRHLPSQQKTLHTPCPETLAGRSRWSVWRPEVTCSCISAFGGSAVRSDILCLLSYFSLSYLNIKQPDVMKCIKLN